MTNFKCFLYQIFFILLVMITKSSLGYSGKKYSKEDLIKLREEVREMFNHAYSGYLKYAYPYDELRPLTCDGVDTWGSYSLTLIDALDTLAVMGNYSEFRRVVDIVISKANFDANINVSVFETNIRIVGGLLSAHLLSHRAGVELEPGWPCNGPLLRLAEDVARRLITAFDTTTGMPYGTVNLRHGVPPGETSVTCTAAVGTFVLEFGTLSRLTGDPLYEEVAMNALHALYNHRSSIGLYGNHIDVITGRWTAQDSGIGAGVDSYLEYLVKGALLMQRPELMAIFNEGRTAIDKYLKRNDWYLWVSMHKGQVTLPVFQSLEAYWPGVLSLIGDITGGMKSLHNYHQVWKQYGFTPEFYNIAQGQVGTNREGYPLRPELIESTMYLYRATGDPYLLDVGLDILRSIQHSARTSCGYATIKDCRDHSLENRMESFFLAETTKYLYLLFDTDNFIHNNGQQGRVHTLPSGRECVLDSGGYIFNTEAHPIDPGALLCCSEDFNVPKRYNRGSARGEKFTSFLKSDQEIQSSSENQHSQSELDGKQHPEASDLPSAFTDEGPVVGKSEKLQSSAVDVINIPPPTAGEVHPLNNYFRKKRLPINMLQMIETVLSNNLEKHLKHMKTAWSHDLLKELIEVIEHAEEILNRKKHVVEENIKNSENNAYRNFDKKKDADLKEPTSEKGRDGNYSELINELSQRTEVNNESDENNNVDDISLINSVNTASSIKKENIDEKMISENKLESSKQSSHIIQNESEDLSKEKKEKSLFELVMMQQFTTIKKAVLAESDLVIYHLTKCIDNLELTKSLDAVIDEPDIRVQFFSQRLNVIVSAKNMKRSIEETKKILNLGESGESVTIDLFKRMTELVIDPRAIQTFLNEYNSFIEICKKLIEMEKDKYNLENKNINSIQNVESIDAELTNSTETDRTKDSNSNEDSGIFLQSDSWKADDMSYQVDDKDRGELGSKADNGPLFTDKLKIKTEAVIGLLPKSLVSSENTFNPQFLLERIRYSPKYYLNATWSAQYELLSCYPQPYFTRIMLSGEFFSD